MDERRTQRVDTCQPATVQTLVISQHEVVRGQLVAYLTRALDLSVRGEPFTSEAIVRAHPDVVVLDLSQIGHAGLVAAIDQARCVGARMVALASIHDLADERAVVNANGVYRLKTAGADGLAEIIRTAASGQVRQEEGWPTPPDWDRRANRGPRSVRVTGGRRLVRGEGRVASQAHMQ